MEIDDRTQRGGSSYGDEARGYQPFGYEDRYGRFGMRYAYEPFGFGYPFEPFGLEYRAERFGYGDEANRREHTWRGGVLGWLGAGIRAGAGWFGISEELRVDRIHGGEIIHVLQEHAAANDLVHAAARSFEHRLKVLQSAFGLLCDAAFHQIAGRGVHRGLSGTEDESISLDRL